MNTKDEAHMIIQRMRCTNCGADFENIEAEQQVFRCTRKGCGAVFLVEQGKKFSDIEEMKAQQIQKLREGLTKSLEPFHGEQVRLYAKEILAMIPEDYRARAALCLEEAVKGHTLSLRHLLEGRPECSEEEFLEMFPFLLARCGYRELLALEGAAEACVESLKRGECLDAIAARKEELRLKSDCYADIPRDVFVCHSSSDAAKAMQVVEALEKDGNQCWISGRNLIPDTPDYWQKIERAVERCKIFLVLCSQAAMLSQDVQHEMDLAEKHGAIRLEVKLDDAQHTTKFRYFFNGISWIDATGGLPGALTEIKTRVFDIVHVETKPVKAKKAPKPKAKKAPKTPGTYTPLPVMLKKDKILFGFLAVAPALVVTLFVGNIIAMMLGQGMETLGLLAELAFAAYGIMALVWANLHLRFRRRSLAVWLTVPAILTLLYLLMDVWEPDFWDDFGSLLEGPLLLFAALFVMAVCIVIGYVKWIKPHAGQKAKEGNGP